MKRDVKGTVRYEEGGQAVQSDMKSEVKGTGSYEEGGSR
jgi:hypothetical protein